MNIDNCTCTDNVVSGVVVRDDKTPFSYFWARTADYREWAKDKPPAYNIFGYLRMVKEREHANRLEF